MRRNPVDFGAIRFLSEGDTLGIFFFPFEWWLQTFLIFTPAKYDPFDSCFWVESTKWSGIKIMLSFCQLLVIECWFPSIFPFESLLTDFLGGGVQIE